MVRRAQRHPAISPGHGLSYTKFDYSKLQVQASADGGVEAPSGSAMSHVGTGSDTPQVYVGASLQLSAGTQQAVRKLVQFQRVASHPRATRPI